jgi:hypothetical protein
MARVLLAAAFGQLAAVVSSYRYAMAAALGRIMHGGLARAFGGWAAAAEARIRGRTLVREACTRWLVRRPFVQWRQTAARGIATRAAAGTAVLRRLQVSHLAHPLRGWAAICRARRRLHHCLRLSLRQKQRRWLKDWQLATLRAAKSCAAEEMAGQRRMVEEMAEEMAEQMQDRGDTEEMQRALDSMKEALSAQARHFDAERRTWKAEKEADGLSTADQVLLRAKLAAQEAQLRRLRAEQDGADEGAVAALRARTHILQSEAQLLRDQLQSSSASSSAEVVSLSLRLAEESGVTVELERQVDTLGQALRQATAVLRAALVDGKLSAHDMLAMTDGIGPAVAPAEGNRTGLPAADAFADLFRTADEHRRQGTSFVACPAPPLAPAPAPAPFPVRRTASPPPGASAAAERDTVAMYADMQREATLLRCGAARILQVRISQRGELNLADFS